MGMLLYMMELSQKENANAKKTGVAETAAPEIVEEKPTVSYTEEDIKKMKGDKVRKFAEENGIENVDEYTVGELKSILCEKIAR